MELSRSSAFTEREGNGCIVLLTTASNHHINICLTGSLWNFASFSVSWRVGGMWCFQVCVDSKETEQIFGSKYQASLFDAWLLKKACMGDIFHCLGFTTCNPCSLFFLDWVRMRLSMDGMFEKLLVKVIWRSDHWSHSKGLFVAWTHVAYHVCSM